MLRILHASPLGGRWARAQVGLGEASRDVEKEPITVRASLRIALVWLGVVAFAWLLYRARAAVAAILAAAVVAVALAHAVEALARWRLSARAAKAVVVAAFLGTLAGAGFALVPRAAGQAADLARRAPVLIRHVESASVVRHFERAFHLAEGARRAQAPPSLKEVAPPAIAAVGGAIGAVVWLAMVLFLSVFMVIFGEELVSAAVLQTRQEHRERYRRVLGSVYRSVGGYLAGLTLICTINATLTTTFLALSRVPYFLALGILSGFASLVPYAGPAVVHTSIALFAWATGGPWQALAVAAYFVVYDALEGNVLGPLVYRRTVHINPLVSLMAVLMLGEFAGVVGALVAVPVAAAAQIIVREYASARRSSPAGGQP